MKNLKANGWVLSLALAGISLCSAAPAFANNYYIAANGSDSNPGTQSQPWAHAPGMPNCANSCASVTPQPGDKFIFKGGDTWHWGITTDTSSIGGRWDWTWSGASGNPIYIGVDKTWYSGPSWSRPIMTGDNPTSTSAVSSCTYDESTSTFIYFYNGHDSYVTLDNLEFTGLCWHGNQSKSNENICCSMYINWYCSQASCNNTLSNLYIHGWTHVTYSCSTSGGHPTGNCDGGIGIDGTSNGAQGGGDTITGTVCDGSDTDGVSLYCVYGDCYQIADSLFSHSSNGPVCNNGHIFHDDIFQDISESTDGVKHSNGFELNGEWSGVNYIYNIVLRDNTAAVTGWTAPNAADVYWNILAYNNAAPFDVDNPTQNIYIYNSTFYDSDTLRGASSQNWYGNLTNVLLVNTSVSNNLGTQTDTISMTDAQATTAGITSSSTSPYDLTSFNCNGQSTPTCPVGTGANLTSSWPAGYTTSDTTFACSYNSTDHTLSCPARAPVARGAASTEHWDVGAYEFGTAMSGAPSPPSSLTAVVN